MPDLDDLYREILLDHYRSPRNRGPLEQTNAYAEGANPLCGDELRVELLLDDDGVITNVAFVGSGCSISQASSSLMTDYVMNLTTQEALAGVAAFQRMMTDGDDPAKDFGDIEALAGVRKFPVRVKCASLAWKTLELALQPQAVDDTNQSPATTDDRRVPSD